ncbi:MAG: adenine deaminase [Saprospiraceae bacterium]|nr:MAG: adenine deaminase [Saprospiraceae bacterium]
MKITGNIVDVHQRRIFYGEITIKDGIIQAITAKKGESAMYILPGFVDAHVHVESSMLIPSEFARLAVVHGTVATVSDPHEIANVLGREGVDFMIENGRKTPFRFFFGAPSCVPATAFETAGASLDAEAVEALLQSDEIMYLSEMMNYPGVISSDAEVLKKIDAAHKHGKPVDGHAPGVTGEDARKYFAAGISTDHECFTLEEGLEKVKLGVKILVREGSAAKNFEALLPLLHEYPGQVMFCSDDKHPDDLVAGHINQLAARALRHGENLFDVLQAACVNAVEHYHLPVGLLRTGDSADFFVTGDMKDFVPEAVYIGGTLVAEHGSSMLPKVSCRPINQFNISPKKPEEFEVRATSQRMRVIQAIEGQLVTGSFWAPPLVHEGFSVADTGRDILKFTVVNRYADAPPAVAFIHGFGFAKGALASSVGHDSHNILAVGTSDASIAQAVNLIVKNKGGISAVSSQREEMVLPLPVAGIMSGEDGHVVAEKYSAINDFVQKTMSCPLKAPFMTLSFMALLVIPELKLSDKGLFDGKAFQFVNLFE